MVNLNLGCGTNKIDGFINIDVEQDCSPDLVCDFTKNPLPFENNYCNEVVMFHTIEHIEKRYHKLVLTEIHRVLAPYGVFLVSFPEFWKCAQNWKNNKDDQKEFWEATIYGRQLYRSDYHVALMDTQEFKELLRQVGFINIGVREEPGEDFNTVVSCVKGPRLQSYEDILANEINSYQLVR